MKSHLAKKQHKYPPLSVIPGIRDYDGYIYFREWSGGLLAGGFEPKAKPCFRDGTPRHFEFQLLQEDWGQFRELSKVHETST